MCEILLATIQPLLLFNQNCKTKLMFCFGLFKCTFLDTVLSSSLRTHFCPVTLSSCFSVFIALSQPVTSFPFHPLPRRLQLEVTRGQTTVRSSPPPNSRKPNYQAKKTKRNLPSLAKRIWKIQETNPRWAVREIVCNNLLNKKSVFAFYSCTAAKWDLWR